MLRKPTLFLCDERSYSESKTLLTEKGVSTVSRTVRPNQMLFRELRDEFLLNGSACPNSVVLCSVVERFSNRMKTWNEIVVNVLPCFFASSGHDVHVKDNVFRISKFNTIFCYRRTERSHAERKNIHCASVHTTFVKSLHRSLEFSGVNPVVCRTCAFLCLGSNKRSFLNTSNIRRI